MARKKRLRLDPELPFREAARETLAARAPDVLEHVEGTRRGEDPEELHQFRTSSRRLRAVLEVYAEAFPSKRHGRLLRLVKDTADASGAARDVDVQREFLEAYLADVPEPDRVGVQRLVRELDRRRAVAALELAPALDRLEAEDFAGQVEHLAGPLDRP